MVLTVEREGDPSVEGLAQPSVGGRGVGQYVRATTSAAHQLAQAARPRSWSAKELNIKIRADVNTNTISPCPCPRGQQTRGKRAAWGPGRHWECLRPMCVWRPFRYEPSMAYETSHWAWAPGGGTGTAELICLSGGLAGGAVSFLSTVDEPAIRPTAALPLPTFKGALGSRQPRGGGGPT